MANATQGNIHFIDTSANDLETNGILVHSATLTATATNGTVILLASSGGGELISFTSAAATDTKHFDFTQKPLVLPKGLHATATNAKLSLVFSRIGAGGK